MRQLSVDVSNLCSFMSQDRVGKFTNRTPKELLAETLKCIKQTSSDEGPIIESFEDIPTLYDEQQGTATPTFITSILIFVR